ncbi:murein hydrolase activator EnvC family protein [Aliikangiella coralliicola]|uniref:Peptidoglycan DD-metalloendopeptidase family protein n=1 Tax=Aliikangiella coralliicola TaxID=2592383 RepID=A0A545UHB8_9GAMM|nr:peptidoglycan DD-metalloendopeptidase family protein [Aliikangiella coralliicola]TQV88860.1 peptidoglycan DD-metalloendopeptidase family protein [Aliikangiella coralliicola]
MNFKLGFYLVLLLSLATSISGWSASADESEKAKQELRQLKKEIDNLQKNLKSKRKQQSRAITRLRTSEKQIATATKILRSTNRQLIQKESQLKTLNRQQKNLEKNKTEQKQALAGQIKSAFISGRQEYLKMLLNQEDPEALGRMLVYYDYMNKARTEKVAKLQQTLKNLENIDREIQAEILELSILKKSKEEETARLKKLKAKRKQLVNALSKEIEAKSERLTELQINAKELQQLIDSVREAIEKIDFTQPLEGLRPLKGKLRWPTKGKTTQRYGARVAEGIRSNGVVISANEGNAVNAIHYGRVVYADWLRGFGLLVIIDHGKGYMSLYGYNQALYKQVGDWVESGEAIATVGQSGGQSLPGLYFELRRQGKPFNPRKWFK